MDNFSPTRAERMQFESILTDCFTQNLCCIMLCEGTAEQGGLTTRPSLAQRIMFQLSAP